jgi:hypothetical protein
LCPPSNRTFSPRRHAEMPILISEFVSFTQSLSRLACEFPWRGMLNYKADREVQLTSGCPVSLHEGHPKGAKPCA